jgi:hypothetical protein
MHWYLKKKTFNLFSDVFFNQIGPNYRTDEVGGGAAAGHDGVGADEGVGGLLRSTSSNICLRHFRQGQIRRCV